MCGVTILMMTSMWMWSVGCGKYNGIEFKTAYVLYAISKTFNSCDDLSMPRTPLAGAANANESS